MEGPINMNGQSISGLNDPTDDTQAARKGYVDAAKTESNAYTNASVRKAAPRNLLDNSDFRNPVNQRGQKSYTGEYGIDRWKQWNSNSTTYVRDGYITVSIIQQYIGVPIDFDTVYTFAAKKTDGTILCLTGTFNTKDNRAGLRLDYDTNTDGAKKPYVSINAGGDYLWAAFYEGNYTAETLPEYQPKGYGAELAECQRYYYRNWDGDMSIRLLAGVFAPIANRTTSIVFPVTMREKPSITLYNPISGNKNCISDWKTDADVSVDTAYVTKHHFMITGNVEASKMYSYLYEATADL